MGFIFFYKLQLKTKSLAIFGADYKVVEAVGCGGGYIKILGGYVAYQCLILVI
jgi:hypothetical protein